MAQLFAQDAFSGKSVLITGATSGIGAGTAKAFAAHGADVVVTGRDAERGEAVVEEIRGAGGTAELRLGDVADGGFCDSVVAETVDRLGRLDVLFNNAGIFIDASIDEMSDDDWHALVETNISGSFYMARAAVRAMKPRGGGVIVNTSSECALIGYQKTAAYSATKSAIIMLTKVMALDHARDGIRVNAVCPGDIDTPMMDQGWGAPGLSTAEMRERIKEHVPTGTIGEPIDIALAVMYLASDAARYVTGIMLPVDGGTTAR